MEARIADLDSPDDALRRRSTESLRRAGAGALPALETVASGSGPLAARSRRLCDRIMADLVAADRLLNDQALATAPLPPEGEWTELSRGAGFHRYRWRSGETVSPRVVELSSLVSGDVGLPLAAVREVSASSEGPWIPVAGRHPEGWQDPAVALGEVQALRLGLARQAIPGAVTVRSRVGAGVLATAWRARLFVRAPGGPAWEAEAWVLKP